MSEKYNNFHFKSKTQSNIIKSNNFTYKFILRVINRVIADRRNLYILDYGCGVGALSLYFASLDNKVIGIDVSSKAINIARESSKIIGYTNKPYFFTLTEGFKNIADKKFDLIICTEVIEHVKDDSNLVRYFSKHLGSGGNIIISTPSLNAPLYKLGLLKGFDKRVGHFRRYTVESLQSLFKKNKFSVLRIEKHESILRNLFFTNTFSGKFVSLFNLPILNDLINAIDEILVKVFGESQIVFVLKKV